VGSDEQGLGVGIADHPDPVIAVEIRQFRLKLGAEVAVFDAVNRALDPLRAANRHPAQAGPEVGVIVGPIEEIGNAFIAGHNAE